MNRKRGGFAPINLLIAGVVAVVLVGVAIFGIGQHLSAVQDAQRASQANSIAAAIEKYYIKNSEYPSVRRLVNAFSDNTPQKVASVIGINVEILEMPGKDKGLILTAAGNATEATIRYTAESSLNNESCQNNLDGGCDRFTLSYFTHNGDSVVIESHHDGSQRSHTADAPVKHVLTAGSGLVHNTAEITSTYTDCTSGAAQYTAKYAYRYRADSGAWSAWTNWTTSPTLIVGATPGKKLEFVGQTRCDEGATEGIASQHSNIETFTPAIGAPLTPSVTLSNDGDTLHATVSIILCEPGETAEYAFRSRKNNSEWSSYGTWSSERSISAASTEGSRYGYQARARCNGAEKPAIVISPVASMARPLTLAPTISATTRTIYAQTTWSWSEPVCPPATIAQYRYKSESNTGYVSDWFGPHVAYTANTWDTSREGFTYTRSIQARCASPHSVGPWGDTASATYSREISTPPAPSHYIQTLSEDGLTLTTEFQASQCKAGTIHAYQYVESTRGTLSPRVQWPTEHLTNATIITQPVVNGSKAQVQVRYRCINTTTGAVGSWSPASTSPLYEVPRS